MSTKESSMPVAIELPLESETFGSQDLENFPEVAKSVTPTQGLLDICVDLAKFEARIFDKHRAAGFSDAYDTRGDPRGLCLIINNRKFRRHEKRIGTDVDCQNLDKLFTQLGYTVRILHNQTAEQMKSECQNFILDPNHERHNSCVLVILSHGTMGRIIGSDSKSVDEKSDILDLFNSPVCKLTGKPKLVIVQACRTQLAVKHKETQHPDITDGGPGCEGAEYVDLVDRMRRLNYKDSEFVENSLTPDFADLLIAHSTLPGYVSWRHKEQGTWFVQAIVQIFSRNFADEHAADMLVQVNKLVSQVFGQNERCQMPCPINQLRKKFYFFPNRE